MKPVEDPQIKPKAVWSPIISAVSAGIIAGLGSGFGSRFATDPYYGSQGRALEHRVLNVEIKAAQIPFNYETRNELLLRVDRLEQTIDQLEKSLELLNRRLERLGC